MSTDPRDTPMMRQYQEAKRQHPGMLLLFRMGDFYETFDGDARTLARVCGITLTSRELSKGDRVPLAAVGTQMKEALLLISNKGFGCLGVTDSDGRLIGIITDGDLRRHMTGSTNLLDRTASEVMTRNPVTIRRDTLAAEALLVLERRKITSIVVVSEDQRVQGVVHLHHLWRTEMF